MFTSKNYCTTYVLLKRFMDQDEKILVHERMLGFTKRRFASVVAVLLHERRFVFFVAVLLHEVEAIMAMIG